MRGSGTGPRKTREPALGAQHPSAGRRPEERGSGGVEGVPEPCHSQSCADSIKWVKSTPWLREREQAEGLGFSSVDGECWPCRGHRRRLRSGGPGRGSTWFDWSRGGRGPQRRGAGCSPGAEGAGGPGSRRRGRENPTQSPGARGAARGGPGRRRQRPSTSRGRARQPRRGSDTKKRPGDTILPEEPWQQT